MWGPLSKVKFYWQLPNKITSWNRLLCLSTCVMNGLSLRVLWPRSNNLIFAVTLKQCSMPTLCYKKRLSYMLPLTIVITVLSSSCRWILPSSLCGCSLYVHGWTTIHVPATMGWWRGRVSSSFQHRLGYNFNTQVALHPHVTAGHVFMAQQHS